MFFNIYICKDLRFLIYKFCIYFQDYTSENLRFKFLPFINELDIIHNSNFFRIWDDFRQFNKIKYAEDNNKIRNVFVSIEKKIKKFNKFSYLELSSTIDRLKYIYNRRNHYYNIRKDFVFRQ